MGLAENARPQNARKLSGKGDFYRVRVGDYRVIYERPACAASAAAGRQA